MAPLLLYARETCIVDIAKKKACHYPPTCTILAIQEYAMRQSVLYAACSLVMLLGLPREVYVSQVHYQEIPHDWERSITNAPAILVVRSAGEPELYREWLFPKSTHHEKKEETRATEWAQPYEIVEVLRPAIDRALGPGQRMLVWREPEYGKEELEYYHRTGNIHSPFILVKAASFVPDSDLLVLFIEAHETIWRPYDGSPPEGIALLKQAAARDLVEAKPLACYLEDRSAFHRDGVAWWLRADGLAVWHALRPAANGGLEEQIGFWRLTAEAWRGYRELIGRTAWAKLDLKQPLLPDETRPRLSVAGSGGGQWLLDLQGPSPEALAYQKLAGALQTGAQELPWLPKRQVQADFGWWPPLIARPEQAKP